MTAEQQATITMRRQENGDGSWHTLIAQALAAAVAEERERIEKLAEIEASSVFEHDPPNQFELGYQRAAQNLLAAIRKGKL